MFLSILIWLAGLLTGIGGYKIYEFIKAKKLNLKWFHWVIGIIWYFMGIFIIAFIGTSMLEKQPQAAAMATLIFGGTFLIITVLLYRFVYRKTSKPSAQPSVKASTTV